MATLSDEDFMSWGWRIPFLLSVVLVAIGWWIRNRVSESRTFTEAMAEAESPPRAPAMDVLREKPMALLTGAGLRVGENISYYIITTFSIFWMTEVAKLSRGAALNAILIGGAQQACRIVERVSHWSTTMSTQPDSAARDGRQVTG